MLMEMKTYFRGLFISLLLLAQNLLDAERLNRTGMVSRKSHFALAAAFPRCTSVSKQESAVIRK